MKKNPSTNNYTFDDFEIVKNNKNVNSMGELGKGAYGKVLLCRMKSTNKLYAIKVLKKSMIRHMKIKSYIKQEMKIQKKIRHNYILKLHFCFEDKKNVFLVLEYAKNGNLFQYVKKKKYLKENEAFIFFIQTAIGLDYIHKNNIIHRDLKPENLLLDAKGNIKISDFGWSALKKSDSRSTFCGTLDYMAPEILKNQHYNHKVDIWSLGIMIFEITQGYPPFRTKSNKEKLSLIGKNLKGNYENYISKECRDIIDFILVVDPKKRPSLERIFKHPFSVKYCKIFNLDIDKFLKKNKEKAKLLMTLKSLKSIDSIEKNKEIEIKINKILKDEKKKELFKFKGSLEEDKFKKIIDEENKFKQVADQEAFKENTDGETQFKDNILDQREKKKFEKKKKKFHFLNNINNNNKKFIINDLLSEITYDDKSPKNIASKHKFEDLDKKNNLLKKREKNFSQMMKEKSSTKNEKNLRNMNRNNNFKIIEKEEGEKKIIINYKLQKIKKPNFNTFEEKLESILTLVGIENDEEFQIYDKMSKNMNDSICSNRIERNSINKNFKKKISHLKRSKSLRGSGKKSISNEKSKLNNSINPVSDFNKSLFNYDQKIKNNPKKLEEKDIKINFESSKNFKNLKREPFIERSNNFMNEKKKKKFNENKKKVIDIKKDINIIKEQKETLNKKFDNLIKKNSNDVQDGEYEDLKKKNNEKLKELNLAHLNKNKNQLNSKIIDESLKIKNYFKKETREKKIKIDLEIKKYKKKDTRTENINFLKMIKDDEEEDIQSIKNFKFEDISEDSNSLLNLKKEKKIFEEKSVGEIIDSDENNIFENSEKHNNLFEENDDLDKNYLKRQTGRFNPVAENFLERKEKLELIKKQKINKEINKEKTERRLNLDVFASYDENDEGKDVNEQEEEEKKKFFEKIDISNKIFSNNLKKTTSKEKKKLKDKISESFEKPKIKTEPKYNLLKNNSKLFKQSFLEDEKRENKKEKLNIIKENDVEKKKKWLEFHNYKKDLKYDFLEDDNLIYDTRDFETVFKNLKKQNTKMKKFIKCIDKEKQYDKYNDDSKVSIENSREKLDRNIKKKIKNFWSSILEGFGCADKR